MSAWLDARRRGRDGHRPARPIPQTVGYRLAGLREAFGGALDDPVARLETAVALRTCTAADIPG